MGWIIEERKGSASTAYCIRLLWLPKDIDFPDDCWWWSHDGSGGYWLCFRSRSDAELYIADTGVYEQ